MKTSGCDLMALNTPEQGEAAGRIGDTLSEVEAEPVVAKYNTVTESEEGRREVAGRLVEQDIVVEVV